MSIYDPDRYIQVSGELFRDVQLSGIFPDSKTFVDSTPKSDPESILNEYQTSKENEHFSLKAFIYEHFNVPKDSSSDFEPGATMEKHIEKLWDYLSRQPDSDVSGHSSLIPLPHPYIVPGGRFREIYYWDTYFTAEGLAVSGHVDIVQNLTRNFAYLIDEVGHVPNGNRQYYLSRSQPPFLVFLVDLLVRNNVDEAPNEFLSALESEYQFWMDDDGEITKESPSYRRIVQLHNGSVLNRYWDDRPLPREESFREDYEMGKDLNPDSAEKVYRHIRAGAESGWDFTSRWFRDGKQMKTIRTTDILPVDLNALLYFLELKLSEWTTGEKAKRFEVAANLRKELIQNTFWNSSAGYFFDFHWPTGQQTDIWSMAGAYPLFVGLATDDQAEDIADVLEQKFLKDGGLVSTLHHTGQQWDYPNGWAPLQWVAIKGLVNYGHEGLAQTIAERWLKLNEKVFDKTGKMMEKYNVADLSLEAGGGEYPLQDGFGWTNGAAVALKEMFDL